MTTVTTTSVRKALTIMLSFLVFPKPLDGTYILGVVCVLGGLGLNVMVKAGEKKDKQEGLSAGDEDEVVDKRNKRSVEDKDGSLNV